MPNRFEWAVEILAIKPTDDILEIGCGHGLAAALICSQLTTGKFTAIDRSEKMITVARAKNRACVEAGKAIFETVTLADFDAGSFDKIFAINVNVFWLKPAKELAAIKKLLKPSGAFYLFYEPPTPDKIQEIVDKLTVNLETHQFAVKQVLRSEAGLCIIAVIQS